MVRRRRDEAIASKDMLLVGRVLSEDDDFMTLEIVKSRSERFTVENGDRFYFLMFMSTKGLPRGVIRPWLPWEDNDL